MKMNKNANKGFSLVELIIVIAIMVVLVALLAPQFLKFVEKSKKSTDMQNVDAIVTAVEVYAIDTEKKNVAGTDKGDELPDGTAVVVTIPYEGSTASVDSDETTTDAYMTAIQNAGIDVASTKIKSSSWVGDKKDVELTFNFDATTGKLTVASNVAAGEDDILGGKKPAE